MSACRLSIRSASFYVCGFVCVGGGGSSEDAWLQTVSTACPHSSLLANSLGVNGGLWVSLVGEGAWIQHRDGGVDRPTPAVLSFRCLCYQALVGKTEMPQLSSVACSILDARSPEQFVFIPDWMMKALRLQPRCAAHAFMWAFCSVVLLTPKQCGARHGVLVVRGAPCNMLRCRQSRKSSIAEQFRTSYYDSCATYASGFACF